MKSNSQEIKRLNERIRFVSSEIEKSIDEYHVLPFNLVLEARHNKIQIDIIKVQTQLAEMVADGKSHEETFPIRLRLQELIGKAKSVGEVNGMLKKISGTSIRIEVTRI